MILNALPILFCLYIDELLCHANDSGVGCHIGYMPCRSWVCRWCCDHGPICASYTKDVVYLWKFAIKHNVLFNASKTICMKIGNNFRELGLNVTLHGTALVWKNKIKYLGNIVTLDLSDSTGVTLKLAFLFRRWINWMWNSTKFRA